MADEIPETEAPETPEPTATDAEPAAEAAAESAPAEEAPDALAPSLEELLERFSRALGDAVVDHAEAHGSLVVRVRPDAWRRAAEIARADLDCDFLSFVSGIDWMPSPRAEGDEGGDTSAPVQPDTMTFGAAGSGGRLQVFGHVQSTSRHWGLTIKTDVDESSPSVESWVEVYPGADWHERECWEMYGVDFTGHPHLRHLYLPSEFEGHPLRKDFALLAREVKPWPGLVDVEPMPGDDSEETPS